MTRGEALLAMEGGARVRQVWSDDSRVSVFHLDGNKYIYCDGTFEYPKGETDFLNCYEYELVPEPDTAEKFVRDMAELLKRDPKEKSLFWLCEKATPDTHDYTWRQRFDALLAQMDGEK